MSAGMSGSLIAVFVLLLLSAFFSGSETALTGVSRARMHVREQEGDRRAALVNRIREKKDRMIGALLLGNNLVNIMASALTTSILIKIFGDAGIIYATAVMTATILIFSEVLPKTYALHHTDGMAMAVAPFVRLVIMIFAPVTEMVSWVVRSILKLFGADITMVSGGSHMELLRGAIDMHRGPEEGVRAQRAMLRSILDLADVDVGEVMTHRKSVIMIDAGQPLGQVIENVLQSPYTRLPVWKERPENIIGVIHVKSLLKEMQLHEGRTDEISLDSLVGEPWYVPDSTTLFDQLQAFRERREHFALVVDEYGSFMGIVTLEDILEEIVGDIDDEMDEIVAGVRKQPNGSYLIDGTVTIRDLNREFEWKLPDDEDYSTLAGLVLHEAQMIPEAGRTFQFYGFTFEVLRRQRNQITLVRVAPPKKAKTA
ncbi:MAG: HlyC/CorC family transporter [Proteobacteria bacterium]|nr:HlyC/CorC family transporter [Pseudomonadota bacterium]